MIERDEILHFLKNLKEKKSDEYYIRNIGLFGSYAKGLAKEQSDIDIFVELTKPDMFALIGIMQETEEHFGTKVDIVQLREKMNPLLKKRILEEGYYA